MQTTRTTTGYQLEGIEVDAKPYSRLPTQQARTLLFVAQGLPQKRIAQEMGVSVNAVKQSCRNLGFQFNTDSMRETVHKAIQQGVLRYIMCILLCLFSSFNQDMERGFRTVRNNRTVRNIRLRRLRELQNDLLAA